MKKTIVAIFAHPDDEAFGPSGTICKLAQENDVYLLCATSGDAGMHHNPAEQHRIEQIREEEVKASAKILDIKQVFFLGFKDGTLSNNLYHKLADAIEEKLAELKADTIITYEPRGVSGHIDHIVISFVSTYVFNKLEGVKTMLQHCITKGQETKDYFIYFPKGYAIDDVDMIVDVGDVWDKKIAAIKTHQSQKDDVEGILKRNEQFPKKEYFFVIKKK